MNYKNGDEYVYWISNFYRNLNDFIIIVLWKKHSEEGGNHQIEKVSEKHG